MKSNNEGFNMNKKDNKRIDQAKKSLVENFTKDFFLSISKGKRR